MIKLEKSKTKALIDLHGWSAIILGFLLYAVVATGTVAVFSDQIRDWSIGTVKHQNPLDSDVTAIVRQLADKVDPKFHEEVGLGSSPAGNLQLFFHTHRAKPSGEIEEYGVQFEVDPSSQEILDQRDGTGAELFNGNEANALSRFLVSIHTELHLPRPWGLLLTGILGLAMLVAAISGFMMHRHLFADMFVLRKDRSAVVAKRDMHTVAGTWGLPFAFILAFTGSFFSFAGSFGIPAMAMVAFGGDQEAMIRTLIGAPETESGIKANTADLNAILADAYARAGAQPNFMSISHLDRGDAKVSLFMPAAEHELEPRQFEYNGVSGSFIKEKPSLGTEPSVGSAVFSLITPLHFGNFAGLLSRFIWVALGFASCYVILTGFDLWIQRRKAEKPNWGVFERYATIFGYGLPLAMLGSAFAYFVAPTLGLSATNSVVFTFCASAAFLLLMGLFIHSNRLIKRMLFGLIAASCLLLPLVRIGTGGPSWLNAIHIENPMVIMIDLLLFILFLACGYQMIKTSAVNVKTTTAPHDGSSLVGNN